MRCRHMAKTFALYRTHRIDLAAQLRTVIVSGCALALISAGPIPLL